MENREPDPLKYESKRILLGYYGIDEKRRYYASDETVKFIGNGVSDGAWRVAVLGISLKRRRYFRASNPKDLAKRIDKAMDEIGRRICFKAAPEIPACIVRSLLLRPVVLFYTCEENNTPVLSAYAGRGLLGFLAKDRAFGKVEKLLDGALIREQMSEVEKPEKKSGKGKDEKRRSGNEEQKKGK